MMKKYFLGCLLILQSCLVYSQADSCPTVYALGAYDKAFAEGLGVVKLGPLAKDKIPPFMPQSFLEPDGHYGGGEVFCSVKIACRTLQQLLENKILPADEHWLIYELAANWPSDVYELYPFDFRLNHSVKVLRLAATQCQPQV